MDNRNHEAVDSVTNHNEEVTEINTDDVQAMKARIAELEEVAKNKAIEARRAKKESTATTGGVDPSILERITRMELKDNGIQDKEEIDLVMKKANDLGIDPIVLVKEGLAEGPLAQYRKAKADELATPGTSSRATASTKDSAEYWIAKGELPPADQVELRRKIVAHKLSQSNRAKMFNYDI